MTEHRSDRALVQRIAEHYTPGPLGAVDRARLREGIDARVRTAHPSPRWWMVAATAVPALLLALLVLRGGPVPAPEVAETAGAAAWADAVFVPPEVVESAAGFDPEQAGWPDDYRAIDEILLGG